MKESDSGDFVEAFLLLRRSAEAKFDEILHAVDLAQGRVLHAVPPIAMIVFVPASALAELRVHPGVDRVATDMIGDEHRERISPLAKDAVFVWNEHLRSRRQAGRRGGSARVLTWDAPGRLPPDPPRRVLERLRRREQRGGSSGG